MGRIVELGCGLGNRLFSMSKERELHPNTTFVWAPDAGTFFDEGVVYNRSTAFEDLFVTNVSVATLPANVVLPVYVRPLEMHYFPHRGFNSNSTASRAHVLTVAQYQRVNWRGPVACCVCSQSSSAECSPFLRSLRPHPSLVAPLVELRRHLGKDSTVLHLRNEKAVDYDKIDRSVPTGKIDELVRQNFTYAAVERLQDAELIRRMSPRTLLQSDFRNVTFGRTDIDAHRTAVFDMYAIGMAHSVISSQQISSFAKAARCLHLGTHHSH